MLQLGAYLIRNQLCKYVDFNWEVPSEVHCSFLNLSDALKVLKTGKVRKALDFSP